MDRASLKLTERGVALLWLTLIIGLVGVFRIDAAMVMLALTLLGMVLAARWWARRNLDAITVERRLPETAFAAFAEEVPFTIGNGRPWLEARGLVLRAGGGVSASGQLQPGTIAPGEAVETTARQRAPARGLHRGGWWQAVASYPGGLFEARRRGEFDDQRLVFPSPVLPPKLAEVLERAKMERMMRWRLQHEVGGEFHGIRDYQVGDPIKAIHWPASARAGVLMSRQWDPPAPTAGRIGIVVHSLAPSKRVIRLALFEAALRAACGLVRHCRHEGMSVSFAAGFDDWIVRRAPDADRFGDVFECLALAQRDGDSRWEDVRRAIVGLSADCERIFIIGDAPLESWEEKINSISVNVPLISVSGETVEIRRPMLKMRRLQPEVKTS